PAATGDNRVAMTAVAATDLEGNGPVEYYFANLTDPPHDSGWQTIRPFVDWALAYETTYAYTVKARDTSGNYIETGASPVVEVTTAAEPALTGYLRDEGFWQSAVFEEPVAYSIYHATSDSGGVRLPTIVYIQNSGVPRL